MRRPRLQEWADYFRGSLSAESCEQLDRLAGKSPRIARDREHARRLHGALSCISGAEPEDLSWDHVGARIHWAMSLNRRQARPESRRRRSLAFALAAAAVITLGLSLWPDRDVPATAVLAPQAVPAAPMTVSAPVPVRGLVTMMTGTVSRDGAPLLDSLNQPVQAGTTLATEEGSVAVQFEQGAGFHLGPASALVLRRFDDEAIELEVQGRVDVDLTHRPDGQRFIITVASSRVEVRGTRFRVDEQEGAVLVACTRGEVAVSVVGAKDFAVAAGTVLQVRGRQAHAARLAKKELEELDRSLEIPMLATWDAAWDGSQLHPSGLLALEPSAFDHVVDGVGMGRGALRLRVAPGRHHVASRGASGWSKGAWHEVAANEEKVVLAERPARNRVARPNPRREAVVRAIEASGARSCVRGLEKKGLASGAYLELEMGVNRDGSHSYLNVSAADLPAPARRCIVDALDLLDHGAGPTLHLRYRLRF